MVDLYLYVHVVCGEFDYGIKGNFVPKIKIKMIL